MLTVTCLYNKNVLCLLLKYIYLIISKKTANILCLQNKKKEHFRHSFALQIKFKSKEISKILNLYIYDKHKIYKSIKHEQATKNLIDEVEFLI